MSSLAHLRLSLSGQACLVIYWNGKIFALFFVWFFFLQFYLSAYWLKLSNFRKAYLDLINPIYINHKMMTDIQQPFYHIRLHTSSLRVAVPPPPPPQLLIFDWKWTIHARPFKPVKWGWLAYMTSTVHGICIFAILCLVTPPFLLLHYIHT